jgi:hypothetical protein
MKRLEKITGISLALAGILAFTQPSICLAKPKSSPTQNGSLPQGKPFQYLNSRIDSLQGQLNTLIGQVSNLEAWRVKAELVMLKLRQNTVKNAKAIALLESEIENINTLLDTKQDIIDGQCPDNQYVYKITNSPAGLVCRADIGANGLAVLTVKTSYEIAAKAAAIFSSQCPTGSVVSGGSYDASPALTVSSAGIVENGYEVNVANTSDALQTLNITATCLAVLAP